MNNFKTYKKKNVFKLLNKDISSEEVESLYSVTQVSYFAILREAQNNSCPMASTYWWHQSADKMPIVGSYLS